MTVIPLLDHKCHKLMVKCPQTLPSVTGINKLKKNVATAIIKYYYY